jgi:hypothetical protein
MSRINPFVKKTIFVSFLIAMVSTDQSVDSSVYQNNKHKIHNGNSELD